LNHFQNENIKKVKALLNIVGSPFDKPHVDLNHFSFDELYEIAQRNKIGLLFLESLSKQQQEIIPDELLETKLNAQTQLYQHLLSTAVRTATLLNEIECKYAIVKSIMPFHAVPNDVDVLILGNRKDYVSAIEHMKANNFEPIGEEAPLEISLHDSSRAQHVNPWIKDPFDVDIYREVGASYIIYMKKQRIVDQVDHITINNTRINVLKATSELALSIFHSIYPERIYTLMLHFYILYTTKQMSHSDIDNFLQICTDQKIKNAVLTTLSLAELIQGMCFDVTPNKITDIIEALGGKRQQIAIDSLPYKYPLKAILKSFWNKKEDRVFSVSLIRQLIATLSSPKIAKHIVKEYSHRRDRETY
jgi:hypothetical protein